MSTAIEKEIESGEYKLTKKYERRAALLNDLLALDRQIVEDTNYKLGLQTGLSSIRGEKPIIYMPTSGASVSADDPYLPNPFVGYKPSTDFSDADGHLLEGANQIGGAKWLDDDCTIYAFTQEGLLTMLREFAASSGEVQETSIPANRLLDLSNLIRSAILHGRGHLCNQETRKEIVPLSEEDLAAIMSFDPEGLSPFDRLQELTLWAWRQNPKRTPSLSGTVGKTNGAFKDAPKFGAEGGLVGGKPEPERKTLDQLAEELQEASQRYHGSKIEHTKSGARYRIIGVHHRESDMALSVEYTPLGAFYNRVKFGRSIEEMDFGRRFVFQGDPVLGNAELDGVAANHLNHSKRGFQPK